MIERAFNFGDHARGHPRIGGLKPNGTESCAKHPQVLDQRRLADAEHRA